ncbi:MULTISPECIES: carboxymuconolactone decarboxylase family protein [Rhodococcus]|uniref:Carboxymuconolactone decarboxylase family protein n=1 Tax=Rhodococcus rhodochrous TaxID=1829 RepID=A0AA47AA74_RHORH|nr:MULTISPECIES: carboxymuconolactone decarboxylase family protein [Rhodococcus]MCB8913772.1 carboxymuconolactone decarboxylase family protein [Rhodococcus rhodochrous]MDC3728088.1 carboxymuconolactone decarboxylase family protein [Rhodococcus sp. Rp3]UZF48114.1 carboxymuconolactone decarboxylase family protein [Rhodococcus rhodochrous]WSE25402.1 carboxymuconolactone decarboxylase family protein [Rhodococcus sp. PD04]
MTTATPTRVSIDKQTRPVYRAQVAVAVAVRDAVAHAGLDRTLVELVNIRISQINGCAYCLDVHTRDALAGGESPQRLAVLPAWRETELFTDRERAALTLAEMVTTLPTPDLQDRDYADARAHLTDDQLSAIVWVAIAMNAFNRISILSRHRVRRCTSDT